MKRIASSIMVGLALLLGEVAGGGSAMAGDRPTLYYIFSEEQEEQRQRAEWLGQISPIYAAQLEVALVERNSVETSALPGDLVGLLEEKGDRVLLLDAVGRPLDQGSGFELERVLSDFVRNMATTEVDESTWGKIKELFR